MYLSCHTKWGLSILTHTAEEMEESLKETDTTSKVP